MFRIVGTAPLVIWLAACTGASPEDSSGDTFTMPSYLVTASGVSPVQAAAMEGLLGTQGLLREDGALTYIDAERFNRLPTRPVEPSASPPDENGRAVAQVADAIDLEALLALPVISEDEAIARASELLASAGVLPEGEPVIGHTRFQGYEGEVQVADAIIATKVGWQRELAGHRLTGPGAKAVVEFDSEGEVTFLLHTQRTLQEGPEVAVFGPQRAQELCQEQMGPQAVEVEAELVYYAPPLEQQVGRILPHYECTGKQPDGSDIRSQYLPAVLDKPQVELAVDVSGSELEGMASVRGGTGPYTYTWTSSSASLSAQDGETVHYTARSRQPLETLTLQVTDADGLTVTVSETVEVLVASAEPIDFRGTPYGTVGVEWIGAAGCGDLPRMAANVSGFSSRFTSAGLAPSFSWGDWNAWETDFKDVGYGGQDSSMADNVDLMFYGGHADGTGFQFCTQQSDTWQGFGDSQWGEDWNLEWLVVAACGPLQDDGGAWVNRWYQAFGGLHMILAYATVSRDNTIEGARFSDYILRSSPLTMLDAWVATAQEAQSTGVTWATLGPANASWVAVNYDDYYWGMGPTGADEYAPPAFWRLEGDCL
jgi:hypothetical protein